MKSINILLAGEGGQGIQTIAKVLSVAAFGEGQEISYIPSFGVEQRGTPSVSFLIIGNKAIDYPRFNIADYVVVLQSRAIKSVNGHIGGKTRVVFDSSVIQKNALPKNALQYFGLPATEIAYENFIPKVFNTIVLGKLSNLFNLTYESTWSAIVEILGKKFHDKKIEKLNREAFKFGRELVFETSRFSVPKYCPSSDKIFFKGYGKVGTILPERCKGCGICLEKCPVRALSWSETLGVYANPVPQCDLEKCIACGNCGQFCPDGAILIEKESRAN